MSTSTKGNSRRRIVGAGMAATGGLFAAVAEKTHPNQTLALIHSLRSILGNFSERQVSDADVATVLDASVGAANASNM